MKKIMMGLVLIYIYSCNSGVYFPVSQITPSSVIKTKAKKDKFSNTAISVVATNLTDQFSDPKKVYVVWITSKNNGIRNLGELKKKNRKRSTLKTLTAFEPVEIFITAEKEGDIISPSGIEISRIGL